MKLCSYTHYDLDGVVSKILVDKIFGHFTDQEEIPNKCSGYGKIDENINKFIDQGFDSIVITDLNFTVEQMQHVLDNFKHVWFYDHHDGSDAVVKEFKDHINMVRCVWTKEFSGTGIMLREYIQFLKTKFKETPSKEIMELAMITDVYDLWKTDSKLFKKAFQLNQLFWRYSFWDFEKKFSDGFSGFTDEEIEFLQAEEDRISEALDECPIEEHDDNVLTILIPDGSLLNHVGLHFPEMKVLLIIVFDEISGEYKMSIRANDSPTINVNDIISSLVDKKGIIKSAGGHAAAGGINFADGTTVQEILQYNKDTLALLFTDVPW